MSKPRVRVPKKAEAGEIITIKTLISHQMESGQRRDRDSGEVIPRKIIHKFTCTFNGTEVFSADIDPSVSANPYLEFSCKVPESGTFSFLWLDDDGTEYTTEKKIEVS